MSQPPENLDMNVLDLGFFRAIQSLQHQVHQKGTNNLISSTDHKCFPGSALAKAHEHFSYMARLYDRIHEVWLRKSIQDSSYD